MSVNEKMTAIADAIREKTGGADPLTLDGMATGVGQVYDCGVAAEHARCVEKHFVTTVLGNGTQKITFNLPFAPDFLAVLCSDSDIYGIATPTVYGTWIDLSGFGFIGGVAYVGKTPDGIIGSLMTTTSIHNRYSRAGDGTVTLQNVGTPDVGVFKANRPYLICAAKYVEQSDKERITEYVRSLTGSGSVWLNKNKVNAAFTDAEWSALIAEKPSYTFSFI